MPGTRGTVVSVMDRRLPLLTVLVAVVTSVLVAVAPLRQSQSCSVRTDAGEPSGVVECQSSTSSLVEGEGVGVLVVLAVPVALALLGLAWPMQMALVAIAILLSIGVVLTGFSIGLFYVPTAVMAWAAAIRASPRSR